MVITKSENLYSQAVSLLPGGVDSPVRAFKSVGGTPLFMKEGRGSHIIDEDGNDYIDYCMSWGPLILGHADKDVLEAVRETALKGTSFGTTTREEIDLAKHICGLVPSIDRVRFVNSGTEATMSAVRLARGYTGRKVVVKFDGCYHGHADTFLVRAGSGVITLGIPGSPGVPEDIVKNTLSIPYNDTVTLERTLREATAGSGCRLERTDTGLEDVFIHLMGQAVDRTGERP